MPPRIPGLLALPNLLSLCFRPAPAPPTAVVFALAAVRGVVTISGTRKRREKKQARKNKEKMILRMQTVDPYLLTQKEQRLKAHLERRKELVAERAKAWGSPVHGVTTPFVESFDSAGQDIYSNPPRDEEGRALEDLHELPTSPDLMNHNLTRSELRDTLAYAQALTRPLEPNPVAAANPTADPFAPQAIEHDCQAKLDAHAAKHARIAVALERILNLTNAGGKHRRHANIRRCVDTFGRHTTDWSLDSPMPMPPEYGMRSPPLAHRAGPDTGSSEVQIAILTMKIRSLAKSLEAPKGNNDKHGKRNLRKMCHKRQKLLAYMERKERGSGRWHYMIETLGLSPATWKQQIEIK